MDITIGKARRGQLSDPLPGQAYVGRPSPLGNPFQLGRAGSRAAEPRWPPDAAGRGKQLPPFARYDARAAQAGLLRSAALAPTAKAGSTTHRRRFAGRSPKEEKLRDLIVLPEDSVTPWIKPWIATAGSNLSLFTGQVDRGGNSIPLELEMAPWAELGALLVQLAEAKKLDVSAKKGSRSVRFLRSLFGARQHGHAGPGRAVEVVDLSKKLSQRLSGLGADVALRRPDASQ